MLTPQVGTRYAKKMGISTFAPGDEEYLPTTLGGITHGVTALDMTQAFSVLANEGLSWIYIRLDGSKIAGEIIYEYSPNPGRF